MYEEINLSLMMKNESPLRGMNIGSEKTVFIKEISGIHTIDLRVMPKSDSHKTICQTLNISLPPATGHSQVSGNTIHSLCLAPDWWLLLGYPNAIEKLTLLKMKQEFHFSFVDVTGQRTSIEIVGPHARNVLSHIWEQDLRDKYFPVGGVSQGLMVKAPVIMYRLESLKYRLLVRSSFAVHVWKALEDAAVEWM